MRRKEQDPVNLAFYRGVLSFTSDEACNVDFSRYICCLSERHLWQCCRRALCSRFVALQPCAWYRLAFNIYTPQWGGMCSRVGCRRIQIFMETRKPIFQ